MCPGAAARGAVSTPKGVARASAEEAGRRLKFLADASAALASLDYEVTLQRVAQLAVPSFADFVMIDLARRDGRNSAGGVRAPGSGEGSAAPADGSVLPERESRRPPVARGARERGADRSSRRSMTTGRERLARNPEHLAVVRALHPMSAIMAPLSARGHTLGLMTFACSAPRGAGTMRRTSRSPARSRSGRRWPSTMRGCIARARSRATTPRRRAEPRVSSSPS